MIDLVTTPNYTPSSVVPIVESCSAALPAAKFSDLLQKNYIEGHTTIYWAIVDGRKEALLAFVRFISQIQCPDNLHLACMVTNDHALFTQLNLGRDMIGAKGETLKRSLLCSPQENHEVGVDEDRFVVSFRFKMCRKRLRMTYSMGTEFVARGRIWWLRIFYCAPGEEWIIATGLSQPSLPVRPLAKLIIEAQREKPGCATRPAAWQWTIGLNKLRLIAPVGNTAYLDCDGTLHAKLEIELKCKGRSE
ncbi:hypothetical protein AZE42_09268 [Rhizopogon vesiculosus]|uniref:Uncharacterized protein n=1 Tax=Rhizopogon vesiculosus TaxID=180088 RepID=A0A1J8QGS5_9AGAM|nr:hypothetical protein AZE42_09268 [Rhizopogon vesiculosus]